MTKSSKNDKYTNQIKVLFQRQLIVFSFKFNIIHLGLLIELIY